jgi:hypothetical protein
METVRSELASTDMFSRANTTMGDRVRVSPISVPIDQYIFAQKHLCVLRSHQATCTCSMLTNACAKLCTLEGGRIPLRELWKQATGSAPSSGGAMAILDRLMKAPVVCFRIDNANSNANAWMVMAKEEGTDYSRFDGLLGALNPLPPTGGCALVCRPPIPTTRLRALKKMASSDADRKLIQLAALDGLGYGEQQRVIGSHDVGSAQQRADLNENLEIALATFEAFTDLAKTQSLSQISARLGVQILEGDVEIELQRLKEEVEAQEQPENIEHENDTVRTS